MDYPDFVKVDGKEYKINSDFRIAIKCNQIAEDSTIKDFERALAIIYLLFGDEALKDGKEHPEKYEKFLKLAVIFLLCENEKDTSNEKPDMDFIKDEKYIKSSFKYDYNYDPYALDYLHWYEYCNDLNNLSNSEMGDCCVLNRVRNLRNLDLSKIKDPKERERLKKAKKMVDLDKNKKENHLTSAQEKSMEELNKLIGI